MRASVVSRLRFENRSLTAAARKECRVAAQNQYPAAAAGRRIRSYAVSAAAIAVSSVLLTAQPSDSVFAGPVLGHVLDEDKQQIRIVSGVPGAALVRSALALDAAPERMLTAPGGRYALVSAAGADAVLLLRDLDNQPSLEPLAGAAKRFNMAAFSPAGAVAVLYAAECECLEVVTGLPQAPQVSRVLSRDSIPGDIVGMAVSDDGSLVAVAAASGEATEVFLLDSRDGAPPRFLLSGGPALAFSPDNKDLAVGDRGRRSISLIRDVAGATEIIELAAEREGLSDPIAATFAGRDRLLIADGGGFIHVINIETGEQQSVVCTCAPRFLETTMIERMYRVTGMGSGAVWVLDAREAEARVWFVPIGRGADPVTPESVQ